MKKQLHPEAMKVLVALAKNLRASGKNVREKNFRMSYWKKQANIHPFDIADWKNDEKMEHQARMMHHALYNAFFIAKKAVDRT